jgi:GNAT superfamily N-acetyltransferase
MTITQRSFNFDSDFDKVSQFLVETYYNPATPQLGHINWLQSRWEYMHFHPLITDVDRSKIGVWESGGEIVGVAHPEHPGSPAYFEIRPGFESIKAEMLDYYEREIRVTPDGLDNHEGIYLMGGDDEFGQIASAAGYTKSDDAEPMSIVPTDQVPDSAPLPDGFKLISLTDENSPKKSHQVLWRGFNHECDPDENGLVEHDFVNGIAEREFMQSAPNFAFDLNVVAVAPNGDWISYSGMWYEPTNKYCYVEPVATDPEYRLKGLGKAAVTESIRRATLLGAEVAYVGATLPIYKSISFEQVYSLEKWVQSSG